MLRASAGVTKSTHSTPTSAASSGQICVRGSESNCEQDSHEMKRYIIQSIKLTFERAHRRELAEQPAVHRTRDVARKDHAFKEEDVGLVAP